MRLGSLTIAASIAATMVASSAYAQGPGFVSGPFTWTPSVQLREGGVDSNVFNQSADPQQDVTGGLGAQVDSILQLPAFALSLHGASEYEYFERYKSQAGLNSNVAARVLFSLTRFQPTLYGGFVRAKDRTSNELDIRAPRRDHNYGGGIAANLGRRFAVTVDASRMYTEYAKGQQFRGADIATQLNHRGSNLTSGVRVALTPFTSLSVDGGFGLDEFDSNRSLNTQNIRGTVTVNFSPDAVINGHATVGYHKMNPVYKQVGPGGATGFTGATSSVDLGYTLLGVTRVGGRYARDTSYSVSGTSSYYLSTTVGLDLTQALPGPFTLLLRGSREKLGYPTTALAAGHTDRADIYGAGLQITVSTQAHIALNYDIARRRSGTDAAIDYDRTHIYTTVIYGF